ncbi:hypothetical protein PR001_g14050 [Phytophthora rubi]|uniref:Uncharacterized protein n=1 Tax=Phytophthora rubi TaxID=129364 RepID=A0A6A3LD92_9STRA|nr:hypothetical protein PR002_g14324 [Phytophthora rubi]KAE9018770.1 hypothetical protein PR001_g14050 [Phytophthora rubi]
MLFLLTLEVLTERSPVTAVTAALGVGSTTSVAASACYLPHWQREVQRHRPLRQVQVVDEVCKKRLYVRCIANVDPCVFQDEDFIAALGPAVVDDEEEDDDVKDEGECEFDRCDANGSYASLGSTVACSESESGGCPDDVSAELCLGNVLERSMALQTLDRLVNAQGAALEKQTVFARSRLFQSQLHPSQLSLSNSQSSLQQSRLTQSQLCHLQTLFQQCRLTQSQLSQSQCQVDHSQSRLRQAQFDESIVAQLRADVEDHLKRTVRTTLRGTRAGGGFAGADNSKVLHHVVGA